MKLCVETQKATNWHREHEKIRSLKINVCLFML